MGLEPIRLLTHAPQTCLSAYSSTTAYFILLLLCLTTDNNITDILYNVKYFFQFQKIFSRIPCAAINRLNTSSVPAAVAGRITESGSFRPLLLFVYLRSEIYLRAYR